MQDGKSNQPENIAESENKDLKDQDITSIEITKDKYNEEEKKKHNKRILIIAGIAFILAIILIAILLLFMFCGRQNIEEDQSTQTIETTATTEASGTAPTTESSIITSAGGDEDEDSETTAEQTTEEEPADEDGTDDSLETDATVESAAEAPTISIAIIEGPLYSSADGVCFYRVKATVTGTSPVTINWSQDASDSSFGNDVAQVNLADPSQSYTLTGTASNSAGSASDSITLTWGCNRPPDVTGISVASEIIAGQQYTVSASATDPDGDALSYSWSVNGGSFNNPVANPVQWTAPGTTGSFNITVTVNDGRGGTDSMTKTVNVQALNREPSLGSITVKESGTNTSVSFAYTGRQYDISVSATDPDGDSLSYSWSVSGVNPGTISNQSGNPALWTAPYSASIVTFSVTVDDGRGGIVTKSRDIEVRYYVY